MIRATWKETSGHCVYCNARSPENLQTIDHLWPRSKGGTLSRENRVPACADCNVKRGTAFPAHPLCHPAWRAWVKIREERLGLGHHNG